MCIFPLVPFINLLPLWAKFTLSFLLCENESGPFQYFPSTAGWKLSLVCGGHWRDGRRKEFCFLVLVRLLLQGQLFPTPAPAVQMIPPAPNSHSEWQPAVPSSQIPPAPPKWFWSCVPSVKLPWATSPGTWRADFQQVPPGRPHSNLSTGQWNSATPSP